jgi:hypothetical protein
VSIRGRGLNLVYLDFDGVLHPEDELWHPRHGIYLGLDAQGHRLFENAQMLIDALEPYPNVRVVLSTSWVSFRGFGKTLKRLPLVLQQRVVGATFHSLHMQRETFTAVSRGRQVLQDVERRKPANWLALDDDHGDWPAEHVERLVKTDPVWNCEGRSDCRIAAALGDVGSHQANLGNT